MRTEKAYGLRKRIEELQESRASKEAIDKLYAEMGKVALQEENPYLAIMAFKRLNDKKKLKEAGDLAMRKRCLFDACDAYRLINDEKSVEKIVEIASGNKDEFILENVMRGKLIDNIYDDFRRFNRERGFEGSIAFDIPRTFNVAGNLAENYDLGVGIAKGGLFASYALDTMGLPIVLAEAHRTNGGATFKWIDSPENLKGKNVLVIDKDTVSGRTLRRTLKELRKYSPSSVDLFLNHDAIRSRSSWAYSHLESVPEDFGKIYTPIMFNYNNFPKIYKYLKNKFS